MDKAQYGDKGFGVIGIDFVEDKIGTHEAQQSFDVMPLPMWFSGGDQVVDGGNQQRSANDAPLLRLGEEGFQPCGQWPVSAGGQRFRFRRIAVIV